MHPRILAGGNKSRITRSASRADDGLAPLRFLLSSPRHDGVLGSSRVRFPPAPEIWSMVNVSFLQELMNGIAERGRTLLPRSLAGPDTSNELVDLVRALVSGRGEASGVALARQILARYGTLDDVHRQAFFGFLAESLGPDTGVVRAAASAFVAQSTPEAYRKLVRAVEAPRQEFFRRLNLAPGATAAIVAMRRDMLDAMRANPKLAEVDADLMHLLSSWFNRGFLVLRRIDWSTPANILEKIIAYEAVHEIHGWDDLRRRLDPLDRRCFAFFHPSLLDEPLIFVEVALTREIPGSIQDLLSEEKTGTAPARSAGSIGLPTTAVFYSISNCQDGLRGISFGNFLIKQVVEELAREIPSLKTFVTLSPAPGFAAWLAAHLADKDSKELTRKDRAILQVLQDPAWADDADGDPDGDLEVQPLVLGLAAHYFLEAKSANGRTPDPVARFHLGNGARLERINWRGDLSQKGLREAHGVMVNYLYELKEIDKNHETFANTGAVTASRAVRALSRSLEKGRAAAGADAKPSDTAVARDLEADDPRERPASAAGNLRGSLLPAKQKAAPWSSPRPNQQAQLAEPPAAKEEAKS
jgi:malonyl-CoA decarboxylase